MSSYLSINSAYLIIMKPQINADAVLSGAEGLTLIFLAKENTEHSEK